MRRDISRHTHRDAGRAVDQQIGKARRQHRGLPLGAVVIVAEFDGVLVDVFGQRMRDLGAAHLGITHGGGRIAIDRAEIALAVDQRQAHGEILRHAHQRIINRLIAMRVILADDVADHAGGFAIGLVPVVAVFVHRIEDTAMHGFQAVTRIRQRALGRIATLRRGQRVGIIAQKSGLCGAWKRRGNRARFLAFCVAANQQINPI